MEKKKPIKIKFSTAVILIITFTVVILGIGIGIIVFNNSKNNENRTSKYVSAEQKENESPLRLYFRVESARTRVLLLLLRRL